MKDIMGRELHEGDIVVCMAIGQNSTGMHLGVQMAGNSVLTKYGMKSSRNRYLIENPTKMEREYVDALLESRKNELDERKKKEAERKSKRAIRQKDLIEGHRYEDDRGNIWVYMGKRVVIITKDDRSSNSQCGYLYLRPEEEARIVCNEVPFEYLSAATILKTPKRLTKDLGESVCPKLLEPKVEIQERATRLLWRSYQNNIRVMITKSEENNNEGSKSLRLN